jgi:hypothetical protein
MSASSTPETSTRFAGPGVAIASVAVFGCGVGSARAVERMAPWGGAVVGLVTVGVTGAVGGAAAVVEAPVSLGLRCCGV